ncbi:SPFH domain-containing protein [Neisseria gonorrhoeae]
MKLKLKHLTFAIILLVVAGFSLTGCERVEPNQAGVLMENYGRNGKSDFSIVTGRIWTLFPGTQLYQVPLWEQRGKFDEPMSLKAADNTEFSTKPVYSFRVVKDRAVDVVFDNKQLGTGDGFISSLQDNILEPKIYDLMKEESRKFTTDELMAKGGSLNFEQKVQDLIKTEFTKRGLELMTFSSQLAFSKSVTERIDKRNEVNTNLSVLDQQIEEQKKRLELARLQAETNRALSEGITDKLLQQQFIEKWDGKTPLYGNTPVTIFKQEK